MHNMKKVWALLLTGVMAVGCLAGCGGDGETQVATAGNDGSVSVSTDTESGGAGDDSGAGESAGGADTQVMNVRTTSFGNNYDVQDMGWRWMMAACYDGLYRNVNTGDGEEFILAGAESVDISEDQTVYTFHLRQDAKWSDGEPVTAHDYEYG